MPSPVVHAVVTLPHTTTISRDADQNSFTFTSEDVDASALASAISGAGMLPDFYNHANTHSKIGEYLGGCIDRSANACSVEYYDVTTHLDGSSHGIPIRVDHFTLVAKVVASTDIPAENGAVLTLFGAGRAAAAVEGPTVSTIPTPARAQREGAPATHSGRTRPKQSHTGRVYIGPLSLYGFGVTSGECFVSSDFRDDLTAAASRLRAAALALTVPTSWVVWSRRLSLVDDVVGGYVDNAPDIQRRRGVRPIVKSTWS